ncbi:PAS domain-containing sensor histidine kinase [Chondrinema litorale]|uniref:PAS domain-containing sensor histidine kinase n=1 Tax=Chondrinema litorale TaxID=2994555 RepID=UPI002542AE6E|nr:PAS domain-containing sensor histidine kinase [Chondrinema litorale]UZR94684.1 PAS domain-containing sensor histidine kinase [Chondrinema litorale]
MNGVVVKTVKKILNIGVFINASDRERNLVRATNRDGIFTLLILIIYFTYTCIAASWGVFNIILLIALIATLSTFLLNYFGFIIVAQYIPSLAGYSMILLGGGSLGYESDIHLLFLLTYLRIFLNIKLLNKLSFYVLFIIPAICIVVLFLNNFNLFPYSLVQEKVDIREVSYLSQFITFTSILFFINMYVLNIGNQKKKLFKVQNELADLLKSSEEINQKLMFSQKELYDANTIQNLIFDNSYDAIFLAKSDTTILNCNSKAVELFEFDSKEDLIGNTGRSFQKHKALDPLGAEHRDTLEKGLTWTVDIEYKTKKGNEFWGNLALKPITIKDEKLLLARVTNVSTKKKSENKVNELKQFYLTTLENQQGLNLRVKKEQKGYRIILARGKFLEKYRTTFHKCEGKFLHEIFLGEDYIFRKQFLDKAWNGEICSYETSIPDTNIYYIVFLSPIYKDGEIYELVGSSVDITDIKLKDQKLTEQNKELKTLNEALDRFVYSSSHDLRAPIASCLGLIEIAKKENDLDNVKNYLDLKEQSLKRLDRFISDILDYSRNTRLPVKQELINVEELVKYTFDNYSYTPQFSKIEKIINVHGSNQFISDSYRLNVILNNLISNAIRYYNPYIENAYIKVDITVDELFLNLEVEDNGLGIEEKHLDNIFNMFYRATDKQSGSGLGLYIVKETVDKLNAQIRVKSKFGKGTNFTLRVPNIQLNESIII